MGGNHFHFHCVWFGENRGDGNCTLGGGGEWRENFVSFLLFGREWKMGGPMYFPPVTPKLDLSKLEK